MVNKHIKRCIALLDTRDMQIKTTWDSTSHPVGSVDEDVEKLDLSYTSGRNVKWCSCFGNSLSVPQELNIELLYHPAILLLGIYPRKLKIYIYTKTCTQILTIALFTIAKI